MSHPKKHRYKCRPNSQRCRPMFTITLSPEESQKLNELVAASQENTSRSGVIAHLIDEAWTSSAKTRLTTKAEP